MKKIALFMFGMFATCSTFAQEYLQIDGELIPVDKIKSITYKIDKTMLSDIISSNTEATIFAEAIEKTGISKLLSNCIDKSYKGSSYAKEIMYSNSPEGPEKAQRPNQRLEGYTAFLVPDATLKTMNIKSLKDLYGYACKVYDEMYPEAVNAPGHSYDNLTDPVNPLYRLIAYHIIDRNIQSYDFLTTRYDLGVATDKVNPTNWYTTLLPGTMLKVERLTVASYQTKDDVLGDRYINRRIDNVYSDVHGTHIVNAGATANNGLYFYVDGILAFDKTTRDVVDNCRIRMDMSDVLPELASNNIRWNGYPYIPAEGINYYLPDGYLKNCSLKGERATLVYRYPRSYFWSAHGDEMRLLGLFDFTMQLPPFPFEGEWQIRLGYSADSYSERAIVDVYFDDTKVQEALDGSLNSGEGYMPGPYSICVLRGYQQSFYDIPQIIRKVLHTVDIDKSALNKPHTLRLVNVGKLNPYNKNWSLDYIELVPKSVYDGNEDNY